MKSADHERPPSTRGTQLAEVEAMPAREPVAVRLFRALLRNWPLPRGKGMLLRLFLGLGRGRDFLMTVEPGIVIPARLDEFVNYWVFVNGYDTEPEVQLSRRLISAGDTIVDVGANIGLWVMGAAARAGPSGSVHAFEPVRENFAQLVDHCALNGLGRIRCRRLAISDCSGTALIYASSNGNCGMASLTRRAGTDRAEETELLPLDRYCEQEQIERLDFLKVYVEGSELRVFKGAQRMLALPAAPIILFEADDSLAASFDSSCRAVKALLSSHAYRFFRYARGQLQPVSTEEAHHHENLFAFKPAHFERYSWLRSLQLPWGSPLAPATFDSTRTLAR
jgi:FkbM family methyltransferase